MVYWEERVGCQLLIYCLSTPNLPFFALLCFCYWISTIPPLPAGTRFRFLSIEGAGGTMEGHWKTRVFLVLVCFFYYTQDPPSFNPIKKATPWDQLQTTRLLLWIFPPPHRPLPHTSSSLHLTHAFSASRYVFLWCHNLSKKVWISAPVGKSPPLVSLFLLLQLPSIGRGDFCTLGIIECPTTYHFRFWDQE